MYLNHYNLNVKPFEITADPEFLWLGEKHNEAYSILRYGVLENKGFLLLTGDVGVGKTTLIASLVNDLSDDIIHTTIADPGVGVMDFYRYLAHGFGLDTSFFTKAEFLMLFRSFLGACHDMGKRVLLIIDETQRMGQKLLEDVRLLSNVERNGVPLLTVFFVGQNEFLLLLKNDSARALRQRITVSYTIEPLGLEDTYRYIAARLRKAGAKTNCFTKAAIEEIYLYSGGAPRMINVLCDMAMVVGFAKEVTRIEKQTIREAARKVPGIAVPVKESSRKRPEEKVYKDVVPEKETELAIVDADDGEPKRRHAGSLFFLMLLVLTLVFVIGVSWFQWGSDGGVLHHSTISKKAVASTVSDAVVSSSPLTYPVTLHFAKESGVMVPESVPLVQAIVDSLKKDRASRLLIRGFAESGADDIANLKISLAKAKFVQHRLIGAGIAEKRIHTYGYGAATGHGVTKFGESPSRVFVVVDLEQL